MAFAFIADRPVLDFLPTLAARGTVDEEKLRSEQDLANWIAASGLVDVPPAVETPDLARARTLREAMFHLIASLIDGEPASRADRDLVNAAARVPPPLVRLSEDGLHREGDVSAVLSVLARDCLELFDSPDRHALHWCADPTCTRPFLDRSRGQRRRWCGMRGCGDRAKAAAYRERRRTARHAEAPVSVDSGSGTPGRT